MIFSSIEFVIFLLIVVSMLRLVRQKPEASKKLILLISSYIFYACWDYRFLTLIIGSTVLNQLVAVKIQKADSSFLKKKWFLASLIVNVGILWFFKYYNFFVESGNAIFGQNGFPLNTLNIILPLGISFFTFQSLTYSIDIYRAKLTSASWLDFAVYSSFFPQLLAGPITRAVAFLPQLKRGIEIRSGNVKRGTSLFLIGFTKKAVMADTLGIFVNEVFTHAELFDGVTVGAAVLAYSAQIYYDFSGYSDMAIGTGKILRI